MPFFAQRKGMHASYVVPEEVDDGETVYCPTCSGRMRPRGGDGNRARHFMHIDNLAEGRATQCAGVDSTVSESEIHRKLKSLAVSGLRSRFSEENLIRAGPEKSIQIYKGGLEVQDRRADALIEFEKKNPFFGKGVIIEVQYRNRDKDIPQVTADYLSAGYSVFWADESDFSADSIDLTRFREGFSNRLAVAFAPYYATEDEAKMLLEAEKYELEHWTFVDPEPDCNHVWHTAGMTNFCMECGTSRRSHEETGRTVYEPFGPKEVPERRLDSPYK